MRENIEVSEVELDGLPLAEILFCVGFFLIYFVEELVHSFLDSSIHNHNAQSIQVRRSSNIHSQSCEAGLTDIQQKDYSTFDTTERRDSAKNNTGTRIFREDVENFLLQQLTKITKIE